ncbi:Rna-binding protein [Datura stramonium]|uniref:Rna-binding protein n=1 Tax=Datura stramonium TaxID=4076 RepID=A0ABS8SYD5_DATST|nr:Rna-binding protein [Datura stramonium]
MENSNKKSPMNHQDFLLSFQDLNLGKNLITSSDHETTTDPLSNSGYLLNDSNFPMAQNGVQSLEWPSTSSSNIWAYDNYNSNNQISSTKYYQKSILDYENIRKSINYECGSSSTYNSMNQSNFGQNLSNNMLSNSCIGVQESAADYSEDYNDWSNEDYSKCLDDLLNQSIAALYHGCLTNLGFDVIKMSKNPKASRLLQKFLELNNYYYIQRTLNEVLDSFFEVMIHESGHVFFLKLVEFCNDIQMELILSTFHVHVDLFVQTAFMKYGSKTIQMLIKILKNKPLAKYCSEIVSLKLVELMTHRTGRYVVEQCFHVFNENQNEVLFLRIISCFKELATNESGCASLNVCINCITNPLRKELLEKIANQSGYLANDPWGNYVVQHVLELGDEEVSSKIFSQLEKQYLTLAFKKGGSHVVEKCIESSKSGMISVVDALLADQKALIQLAKDPFGNYVIQKALKSTKDHRERTRHKALARVLMAHCWDLVHNKLGKHVILSIKSLNPVSQRALYP